MLMIDHPSVKMTMPLITSLSDNNIGVVFCNRSHMPVTMLMDLDSNVIQSKRFQKQLSASIPTNKQIWKQIVEAKIRNQSLLLEQRGMGSNLLAPYYNRVKSGDSTNREGVAARVYWSKLIGKHFIRDRYGEPPNAMLNYGYALLRSMVARSLMNAGLLPTIGIFHRNCYNAFPLADDVMEPYRPFVDDVVLRLREQDINEICTRSKKNILEMLLRDIPSNAIMMSAATLAGIYKGEGKVIVFPNL